MLGRFCPPVAQGGVPPYDGTDALTTWLLLKNLDKASLEFAMNCWI